MLNLLITVFNTVLYEPLFNILVFLYVYLPGQDLGIAIIVLTIIIRLALYPSSIKAVKSQKAVRSLQPKLKEIQKKYKDDKEKQAQETMALYKKEGVSPFGGCLPILIQFPVLIGLFQVLKRGFQSNALSHLYSFMPHPGKISPVFLGFLNLTSPNVFIAIFAAGLQFIQSKMMSSKSKNKSKDKNVGFAEIMQKQMVYFFPIIAFIILLGLPSAIGLYWVVSSLFAIIQQYIVFKKSPN